MSSSFGNGSFPATWHPELSSRGSYSILSSCLITIGLSVWGSLHMNIPEHGAEWKHRWNKACWLFIFLIAPEVVAYIAMRQYLYAKRLSYFMEQNGWAGNPSFLRKLLSKRKVQDQDQDQAECEPLSAEKEQVVKRTSWTVAHSFYVMMGGFAFEPAGDSLNFVPQYRLPSSDSISSWFSSSKARTQVTFTPNGFKRMVMDHFDSIPDISKEYILSQSSVNNLVRSIIYLQVTWFCTQCITCICQGGTISLLELKTFVYVFWTLVTACFWSNKPLDVRTPTLIGNQDLCTTIALMVMGSLKTTPLRKEKSEQENSFEREWCLFRTSCGPLEQPGEPYSKCEPATSQDDPDSSQPQHHAPNDVSSEVFLEEESYPSSVANPGIAESSDPHSNTPKDIRELDENDFETQEAAAVHLYGNETIFDFCLIESRQKEHSRALCHLGICTQHLPYLELSQGDVLRLKLASKAVEAHAGQINIAEAFRDTVCDRLPTRPWADYLQFPAGPDVPPMEFFAFNVITLSFAISGGIYLLAYNAPFPTEIQSQLWRLSALTVFSWWFLTGLVLVFFASILWCIAPKESPTKKVSAGEAVVICIAALIVTMVAMAYMAARAYLMVACFINLAHLPPSAFKVPSWPQYIPHIA